MISLIAALSRNRVIGRDGGLPWRLPEDWDHFVRTTLGKPVVMGRKTWETLKKPLRGRINVVITSQRDYDASGALVFGSLGEALDKLAQHDEIVIGGGERIYDEALPLADRMYLTFVNVELDGDTFFPEYEPDDWREVSRLEIAADDRHAYPFSIVTLDRG